jgi:hypothetical protein
MREGGPVPPSRLLSGCGSFAPASAAESLSVADWAGRLVNFDVGEETPQ